LNSITFTFHAINLARDLFRVALWRIGACQMIRTFFAAAILSLSILPTQAHDNTVGQLKISAPWARATPKGASVGGGYLTITNTGNAPDRLTGGVSAIAREVQVHEMIMENDVMKMRPVTGGLEIKPGATVTLKPGGYHIMFVGLKRGLKQGEHFEVTLEFAKAGKIDIDFATEGIGAMHDSSGSMPGMKMH
jgi:copper(I)-binding protein